MDEERRVAKIAAKGNSQDLEVELAKSRIFEAAYRHIQEVGRAQGVPPSAISWDLDFTLHIHF